MHILVLQTEAKTKAKSNEVISDTQCDWIEDSRTNIEMIIILKFLSSPMKLEQNCYFRKIKLSFYSNRFEFIHSIPIHHSQSQRNILLGWMDVTETSKSYNDSTDCWLSWCYWKSDKFSIYVCMNECTPNVIHRLSGNRKERRKKQKHMYESANILLFKVN